MDEKEQKPMIASTGAKKLFSQVFLRTSQGEKFRIAHDPIKALGREAIMFFTERGLEVNSQDHAGCILTRYIIPAENIRKTGGEYSYFNSHWDLNTKTSPPPIIVAVDATQMSSCLRYITSGDTWTLSWTEENPSKVTMTCANGHRNGRRRWDVNTIDPQDIMSEQRKLLDRSSYSASVIFRSYLLHEMIRDLSISDALRVRIDCDGHRLVLSTEGPLIRAQYEVNDQGVPSIDTLKIEPPSASITSAPPPTKRIKKRDKDIPTTSSTVTTTSTTSTRVGRLNTINHTSDGAVFDVKDTRPSAWPTCGWYVLAFLQHISKARQFSDTVKLYVKRGVNDRGEPDEHPILIAYDCVDFGTLEFLIGAVGSVDGEMLPPYSERCMPEAINTETISCTEFIKNEEPKQERDSDNDEPEPEDEDVLSSLFENKSKKPHGLRASRIVRL